MKRKVVLYTSFLLFSSLLSSYTNHAFAQNSLVINEILASNKTIIHSDWFEYYDYIELYNGTNTDLFIKDYYLSDSKKNLVKWALPYDTIRAKGYMLFWASGDTNLSQHHTNFKLGTEGETVYLLSKSLTILDKIEFGKQFNDTSYCRYPNASDNWVYREPTPGYTNNSSLSAEPTNIAPIKFLAHSTASLVKVLNSTLNEPIHIYDAQGKFLKKEFVESTDYVIDFTNYSAGVYIIKIDNSRFKYIKR